MDEQEALDTDVPLVKIRPEEPGSPTIFIPKRVEMPELPVATTTVAPTISSKDKYALNEIDGAIKSLQTQVGSQMSTTVAASHEEVPAKQSIIQYFKPATGTHKGFTPDKKTVEQMCNRTCNNNVEGCFDSCQNALMAMTPVEFFRTLQSSGGNNNQSAAIETKTIGAKAGFKMENESESRMKILKEIESKLDSYQKENNLTENSETSNKNSNENIEISSLMPPKSWNIFKTNMVLAFSKAKDDQNKRLLKTLRDAAALKANVLKESEDDLRKNVTSDTLTSSTRYLEDTLAAARLKQKQHELPSNDRNPSLSVQGFIGKTNYVEEKSRPSKGSEEEDASSIRYNEHNLERHSERDSYKKKHNNDMVDGIKGKGSRLDSSSDTFYQEPHSEGSRHLQQHDDVVTEDVEGNSSPHESISTFHREPHHDEENLQQNIIPSDTSEVESCLLYTSPSPRDS